MLELVWFLVDWLAAEMLACIFYEAYLPHHCCGFACYRGEIYGFWRFLHFLEAVSDWVCLPMSKILFSGKIILNMMSPALWWLMIWVSCREIWLSCWFIAWFSSEPETVKVHGLVRVTKPLSDLDSNLEVDGFESYPFSLKTLLSLHFISAS